MSLAIGVDIGGTKIAAGLVDEGGQILHYARRETPKRDARAVVDVITELVGELSGITDAEIDGVGLGVAGFVDAGRTRVVFAPNLGWTDLAIRSELEQRLDRRVVVENDANAAAWGEFRFGAGAGRNDMVMVTVGTGVGGGIVLGGRLQRGEHGAAAEFGHMTVVPDGRQCGCGLLGCWEQYASGNALVRFAREFAAEDRNGAKLLLSLGDGTPEGVQGLHITEAAQQGDAVALRAFATLGEWLGRGMASVAALMDPGVFVIGGGVVESGELLMRPARESFAEHLFSKEHWPVTPILPAQLGNAAGIAGAADLTRVD